MSTFPTELLRVVAAAYPRDAPAPLVTRVGTIAGVDLNYTKELLLGIGAQGALPLVNEFTYHPYFFNPDGAREQEEAQRALVASFAGAGSAPIRHVQGGVGAPAEWQPNGALAPYNWSECTQSGSHAASSATWRAKSNPPCFRSSTSATRAAAPTTRGC
jgi:hypothetical protein